jgi:hypothetical protein
LPPFAGSVGTYAQLPVSEPRHASCIACQAAVISSQVCGWTEAITTSSSLRGVTEKFFSSAIPLSVLPPGLRTASARSRMPAAYAELKISAIVS